MKRRMSKVSDETNFINILSNNQVNKDLFEKFSALQRIPRELMSINVGRFTGKLENLYNITLMKSL